MIGWRLHDIARAERRRPLTAHEVSEREWLIVYGAKVERQRRLEARLNEIRFAIGEFDVTNRRRRLTRLESEQLALLVLRERRTLLDLGRSA